MGLILLIIDFYILLFGGGGWGYSRYGYGGGFGIGGLLLIVLVVYLLFGYGSLHVCQEERSDAAISAGPCSSRLSWPLAMTTARRSPTSEKAVGLVALWPR